VSLGDFASWTLGGTDASDLIGATVSSFDDQGRDFQTTTYPVTAGTGSIGSFGLVTNSYFDHRGDLIETASPGGQVQKSTFNGAGEDIADYTTDGAGGDSWADAASVTGDHVVEETLTSFDPDANPILVTEVQRDNDYTGTGALPSATTNHEDRASYTADYYDDANRPTAEEDVGDNGGSSWTRPGSPDASDATHLVTAYGYAADNVQAVTIGGSPTGGTFTLTFSGL
jgi:hypothetical protein